ncbi:FliM/FliN family flagellar motor switch protein [Seohaeicola nanhaiensis]|uniref:Flagellar motor switch protein FliN n=1 Tax=Seohaeicola nanhaiensis TaxID=1387282 RepID=A0ABV9KHF8_9RHOB
MAEDSESGEETGGITQLDIKDAGAGAQASSGGRNIDAMLNVGLQVQIILGRSRMPISQILKLTRGSIIELDKKIGDPVDVLINDRLVARGDLVKLPGDRLGVELTEIVKDFVPGND